MHAPWFFGHFHFGHWFRNVEFGTNGDDYIVGDFRHDLIFGFRGGDELYGGRGNDTIRGGRGDDLVDGGKGNDDLYGGKGNDALLGGDGNDDLEGGDGNDLLIGGAGTDHLHGGCGSDKFVIRQGTGKDYVEDFKSDDKIDLRDFGFATAQDAVDAFVQQGKNAVLNLGGGDKLIIENFKVVDLDASQFIVSDIETGPSSSQSPYVVPVAANVSTVALLTVGDTTSDGTGWQMVGVPDGLGAYDNGDGTFTVLMNHEVGPTQGVVRDHGAAGAFVSKLVIDKATLEVLSGTDLIKEVFLYDINTDAYVSSAYAFNRLCSADLPELNAFYNPLTGLGYDGRIFMSGEETGPPFSVDYGKTFAHFVDGTEAGNSCEIPWLGKMSFENTVANAHTGDKTVIAATDDATPGQVYFYFGDKQSTGTAVEKAGLVDGTLYGLKVTEWDNLTDNNNETNGTTLGGDDQSGFTLVSLGNVEDLNGAGLQTNSEAAGVTEFLRPEDGQWDTLDPSRFYFVTTNAFNAPSRLWVADFVDASNPALGGTIKMLLDGTDLLEDGSPAGQQMFDNMTVNKDGKILIQEDVGNNAHLGKIWEYDPSTDRLTLLATHDADRFITGAPNFLTQDEEASGIIDVTDILGNAGQNAYLLDVQAHYNIAGELVQGGQLLVMYEDKV